MTYEYVCQACGHQFEAQQSIKDPPLTDCPSCGQSAAKRMISQSTFILKGGGWYADLYSSSGKSSSGGGGGGHSCGGGGCGGCG